jgi:hypothetical protein
MRPNNPDLIGGKSEGRKRCGHFGGIALTLVFGLDAVGKLNNAVLRRRRLKASSSDYGSG